MTESQPHFVGGRYRNPWLPADRRSGIVGAIDFVRWQLDQGPREEPPPHERRIGRYRPAVRQPDYGRIRTPRTDAIQATWIGHSSFLVQSGGFNLLTDPIYSERCSPVQFAGPARYADPGVPFDRLPRIDLVVQSHNHYDHLDERTVLALPRTTPFIVPLGVGRWLRKRGFSEVREADWWQTIDIHDGLRATAVPAQHFSGRQLVGDRNATLWCGWIIEAGDRVIYFAGDSGYGPFFREIGERVPEIDLALIPIGAYSPRWFMAPVHCDPFEAVRIFQDVGARHAIGMHWGTFRLTSEPMAEPPLWLERGLDEAGIARERFRTSAFGETITIPEEA
ncbi:MAG: MBL fold metallo-hydrolase [Candidatus Dadabacteria bacterium]|nr:MAG: MBL fold metallo-hydrolase [Candidatus Dadabacteria bacterium]